MIKDYRQVVIIGAGVSGSSTAIRLLAAGISPLMIDEATFPRDCVGEGLSPAVTEYLAELGILDQINRPPFVKKRSFQFVSPSGDKAYTIVDLEKEPYKGGIHAFPWGFNVHRLHFDMVFQDRARAMGAEIRLQTKAGSVHLDEKGAVSAIDLIDRSGSVSIMHTPLVIDCSGRNSVLARQFELRAPLEHVFDGQWANFAVRCHFRNVNMHPLMHDNPHYDAATVNILPGNDCWYWFIPINLDEGLISIGIVARGKMKSFLSGHPNRQRACRALIERHPIIKEIVRDAELDDNIITTARLGHMNTRMCGGGFMCVGDAAFFADPAWGSGVTISLATSKMAAQRAIGATEKQDFSAEYLNGYEQEYRNFIRNPFNSIRAYNYYYNDSDYINFIVKRLASNQRDMDMLGAVLFDYASHESFHSWTFREFKAYVAETGNLPVMDKMSQLDFDTGTFSDGTPGMATGLVAAAH